MLPVAGSLLALSGITLVGALIGLAVTTQLLILCRPVLVPAALVLVFCVTAFFASGAFGHMFLILLSWVVQYLPHVGQAMPEQLHQAKKRMQDMEAYVGQKTKEVGQEIQRKAYEEGK